MLEPGQLDRIGEFYLPELAERQRDFIARTRCAFRDSRVTIDDVVAEGDRVVTRYSWRGVHTGVWDVDLCVVSMRVPPTGREVWDRGIAIHRVADGRLVENWSEWTKPELALQLGALAPSLPHAATDP